ncbi:MAG: hypothetical protein WBE34_19960 [Candidatus Nitrosopolaris sp.]
MVSDDFADVIQWWNNREENGNAWKVNVSNIKDYNLDIKNPNDVEEAIHLSPHDLINTILIDERNTMNLLEEIKELINKEIPK